MVKNLWSVHKYNYSSSKAFFIMAVSELKILILKKVLEF